MTRRRESRSVRSKVWSLAGQCGAAVLLASCHHDATGPAQIATSFQPEIQNVGPALSPAVQTAFDSAVAFWSRAITAGLPVATLTTTAGECGANFPAITNRTIDNVLIQVRVDSIDGPGKILGRSGPCFVRNSPDNRTVLGTMTLDSADMAALATSGHVNEVVLHEMAHVLGFGTLWDSTYFSCLNLKATTGTTPDTYYSCARGRAVFDSIGGTSYTGGNKVPLENCAGISGCGAGTFNSHWRESVFFNELMTGFLNNGTANPLSVLTLAAMQDLGYTVDFSQAQPYSRTFTAPPAGFMTGGTGAGVIDLSDDIEHRPVRFVDRSGRVVRISPQ